MHDRTTCTAGISRQDRDGTWQLVGSGVCLGVGPRAFVLSAGRLLVRVSENLWLGSAGKRVRLLGAATYQDPQYGPPDTQVLDMGFAPLLEHELEYLDRLTCLSAGAIDVEEEPAGRDYVVIAAGDDRGASTRTIPARRAPPPVYRALGLQHTTHVVADVARGVDPAGLVGAGLWRPAAGAVGELLTGIVIDVKDAGGASPRLIATRAPYIVVGIMTYLGMPTHASAYRPPRKARARRRVH